MGKLLYMEKDYFCFWEKMVEKKQRKEAAEKAVSDMRGGWAWQETKGQGEGSGLGNGKILRTRCSRFTISVFM